MTIELPKAVRDELVEALKRHANDDLELEIGDLKARLLLDFVVAEVGPALYNRGVADAEAWVRDRLDDLEGSCHEEPPGRG